MPYRDKEARRLSMIEWRRNHPGKAAEHARNTYQRKAEQYAAKKRELRASEEKSEIIKQQMRDSYSRHREERTEKMREYARLHPEQFLEYSHIRRARLYAARIETINREEVFDRDHGVCYLCGNFVAQDNWDLEHKVPLAKGGAHSYENVAVSHHDCNMSKGVLTDVEFFAQVVMPYDSL